jgi:hypothetical protein
MTVIPLVAQGEEANIGSMREVYLSRDPAYTALELGTESAYPTIVPGGYTIITQERAQDRTVPGKALIPANSVKTVNAFCVQSSQPGHMRRENRNMQQFRMLPASIRLEAYRHRNESNVGQLWNDLAAYNTRLGVSGNFLTSFFERYKQQLEEFIAEFEIIDGQRGAIILIDNEMIGVEIAPNTVAWADQWEALIRDCYGSEAIARQSKTQTVDDSALFGDAETLDELLIKLDKQEEAEFALAERLINEVLDQTERATVTQKEGGFAVLDVETDQWIGQAVKNKDNKLIDVTLLRRDAAERGFRMRRK